MSRDSHCQEPSLSNHPERKRVLTPRHLWAIAVGRVISGDASGWHDGQAKGGPIGMMMATG